MKTIHPRAPVFAGALACLLALFPATGRPQAATQLPTALATRLSELSTGKTPALRGSALASLAIIESFYARRSFEPAWSSSARAQALIDAVRDSANDGLTPDDYHYPQLVQLGKEVAQSQATDHQRAEFDILMTDAAIRLGYHLWFGKVDPVSFDPGWNLARRVPGFDPVVEIERALATPDLAATIREMQPALPLYAGMKRELARYRAIAQRGGWSSIPGGATLRPGDHDARMPALRERLAATGDLPADAPAVDPMSEQVYDSVLEQAVRNFQGRMGLTGDAVIGARTIAEMNVPVANRILQLRVNLDRGRTLLYHLPDEFVVVNIASQQVYYVQQNRVRWSARAQVGKQYRQTPEYRSEINYLVLNPTWTVPPGIIRNDILPAARRDPSSIARKGLKVLDSGGREISPAAVDWGRFSSGNIPYTLRQDPGPTNALGRVKFMFPNPYAVYLHDTPSKALFDADARTTSSGCVRIERPFELAELLLNDPEKWSRSRIEDVVASGKLQNVTLQKKVPVLLVYWTTWVDEGGVVNFRSDTYGRDAKWSKALDQPFRFRREPIS